MRLKMKCAYGNCYIKTYIIHIWDIHVGIFLQCNLFIYILYIYIYIYIYARECIHNTILYYICKHVFIYRNNTHKRPIIKATLKIAKIHLYIDRCQAHMYARVYVMHN